MTTPLLHTAETVAERLYGRGNDSEKFQRRVRHVERRMSSRRWPSVKDGRDRFMTDAHILEAIEIEAVAAVAPPAPRPSGLSPRSRMRSAS